ncbi:MAG TPA: PilZ domain-containing protein [Candidatus Acidoferrales bacterium]|nr:PilZ domain-containing protein [Candidatus Acidoferrales bacterium]
MDDSKSAYSSGMAPDAPTGHESKKRRFIRTLCRVPASVKPFGADISLSGTITDISPAGCYIEMLAPLPIETRVDVSIVSLGSNLECVGVVRHSLGGMGMGVRFDSFSPAQLKKLREMVPELPDFPPNELNPVAAVGQAPVVTPKPVQAPASVPHPSTAGELLEAAVRILLRKGVISRAELAEELEKSKSGKHG